MKFKTITTVIFSSSLLSVYALTISAIVTKDSSLSSHASSSSITSTPSTTFVSATITQKPPSTFTSSSALTTANIAKKDRPLDIIIGPPQTKDKALEIIFGPQPDPPYPEFTPISTYPNLPQEQVAPPPPPPADVGAPMAITTTTSRRWYNIETEPGWPGKSLTPRVSRTPFKSSYWPEPTVHYWMPDPNPWKEGNLRASLAAAAAAPQHPTGFVNSVSSILLYTFGVLLWLV